MGEDAGLKPTATTALSRDLTLHMVPSILKFPAENP
jgi:hypothetical protein